MTRSKEGGTEVTITAIPIKRRIGMEWDEEEEVAGVCVCVGALWDGMGWNGMCGCGLSVIPKKGDGIEERKLCIVSFEISPLSVAEKTLWDSVTATDGRRRERKGRATQQGKGDTTTRQRPRRSNSHSAPVTFSHYYITCCKRPRYHPIGFYTSPKYRNFLSFKVTTQWL